MFDVFFFFFLQEKKEKMEEEEEEVEEYVPVHKRRLQKVRQLQEAKQRKLAPASVSAPVVAPVSAAVAPVSEGPGAGKSSLLDQTLARREAGGAVGAAVEEERKDAEEEQVVEAVTSFKPLIGHRDYARGVVYTESMVMTDWRPPRWTQEVPAEAWSIVREKYRILVDGEEPMPPPLERFEDMKLPRWLIKVLESKGISKPSPIQMQGLPCAFSGRDMIGIAFTGSGKTLVFSLPLFMYALAEETLAPLRPKMGPLGMIIAPSHELAEQTYQIICEWAEAGVAAGAPRVRCMLAIGGTSIRESLTEFDRGGMHILVGTPGRMLHILNERKMDLRLCRYLCMDEADRLIDLGFEESIRDIMSHFPHQRQTLLFSATMPLKIAQFAKSALVRPVIVNVGRAGAAVMSVRQDVEYVPDEDRIVFLLKTLQKTPPPVLIFAENHRDVDDIHEFLLLRNVEAVSIHGGKTQAERSEAVRLFKEGKKDVLVSADVGAKGLDFPGVQHVINFDMPREIENYVHRIGRTGRGGKKGVATTFLGPNCQETILLDLRGILEEAGQRVPDFLKRIQGESLTSSMQNGNAAGCVYCGGLGHRILACPKLENERRKQLAVGTQGGDMGGGM